MSAVLEEEKKEDINRFLTTQKGNNFYSTCTFDTTMADASKEKNDVESQISSLIAIGEVDDAARLAEEKGLLQRALELYKKANDPRSMARIYERLGELEKAMNAYERAHIYNEAARIAEKLGLSQKASAYYAKHMKAVGDIGAH